MERITLNMVPTGVLEVCHASQYDIGREIRFDLINGTDDFVLSGDEDIIIFIRDFKDNLIVSSAPNTSSNYVIWTSSEGELDVSGPAICELRVTKDDDVLGSANFIMEIEADAYDGTGVHVETVGPADICTFETTLPEPLQSVTVNIEASQASGTPTPSTPLPITGYTEANITRRGVNLFDFESWLTSKGVTYTKVGNKYTFNITGTLYTQPFVFSNVDVPVTLSGNIVNLTSIVGMLELLDVNNQLVTRLDEGRTSITGTGSKIRLNYTTSGSISIEAPQVELGSTASEYTPYNGQTYTIAFGQAIYGGVLDVTRGKLHVDKAYKDLGALNYTMYSVAQGNLFRSDEFDIKRVTSTTELPDIISSIFVAVASANRANYTISMVNNTARIDVIDDDYSDAVAFKSAMSGVQIVYPLDTPFDIDLTPEVISAIVGGNNVFADCGKSTVKYLKAGG